LTDVAGKVTAVYLNRKKNGRPVYGAQVNFAVYSVNYTKFHLELVGRLKLAT
jgi:hypothetical protein